MLSHVPRRPFAVVVNPVDPDLLTRISTVADTCLYQLPKRRKECDVVNKCIADRDLFIYDISLLGSQCLVDCRLFATVARPTKLLVVATKTQIKSYFGSLSYSGPCGFMLIDSGDSTLRQAIFSVARARKFVDDRIDNVFEENVVRFLGLDKK